MCKVVELYTQVFDLCIFVYTNIEERGLTDMTPRQKRFCLEFVSSGNATESARKAGYSEKTAKQIGQENLTKPDLKKYIQELTNELESQKIATAREMQEVLTAIIRQEAEEEVVVVEMCGDGISEAVKKKKKPSVKDVTKAVETLARMQGVLDNKTVLNISIPVFGGEDNLEE